MRSSMNVFSSQSFSEALQATYFPNKKLQVTSFEVSGQRWELPAIYSNKPVLNLPLIDFFEPNACSETLQPERLKRLDYVPKACHGIVSSTEWFEKQLNRIYTPAPFICWKNFSSWEDFVAHVRQRRSNLFADNRKQRRRLEKKFGELSFVFDDRRPEVLATCLQWKALQFPKSAHLYSEPEPVKLYQELAARGILVTSSLSTDEHLLSARSGLLYEGRFYGWFSAYNPAYAAYSPGRLSLELLLEDCFRRGHAEYDFLIGNESYKWYYATHTRLIAAVGSPSVGHMMRKLVGSKILPHLKQHPFPNLAKEVCEKLSK
jgi:hypothetical protein